LCCRCCADFQQEFSTLSDGSLEIVNEMGIVAGEQTTVEIAAGTHHAGDVMIKPEGIGGSMVAIVHLDDGLTQVLLSTTV